MCRPLPAHPQVSPFSATWVAEQAQPGTQPFIPPIGVVDARHADPNDSALPLYADPGTAGIPHTVHCGGVKWSAYVCDKYHMNGVTVRIPRGAFPEGGSDHHLSVEDDARAREFDFWGASEPSDVPGSPFDTLTAGQCPYDGDGTDCSGATATNIATSLGRIDPALLIAREHDPHGTLPYAIATVLLCAAPEWVYPATGSDGANTNATPACHDHLGRDGRPPEGVRWFLDLSDAEIDATANAPYDKVILRTLDREHYGGTVTDTNWAGAPGPVLVTLRDGWEPLYREVGAAPGSRGVPVTTLGFDLTQKMKFCTNGTC